MVCLDRRAIDGYRPDEPGRTGQRLKNLEPDALPAPAIEAIVDRGVNGRRSFLDCGRINFPGLMTDMALLVSDVGDRSVVWLEADPAALAAMS